MGADRSKGAALPRAVTDVLMDLADLVQKELRLARAELSAKLTTKLRAGIWVSIAAGCALVAVVFAAEGVVIWITNFGIALHLSCLIVAGVMAAAAWLAYYQGRADAQEELTPTRTIHQIKQDITTTKEQLR
jgi:hypothetical protein